MLSKRFLWIGGVLLVLNLVIFFNRNRGFDFKDSVQPDQLYAPNTHLYHAFSFKSEDLLAGKKLLEDEAGIDTCKNEQEKLLCIDQFLFESICQNRVYGKSNQSDYNPLLLFENLRRNKKLPFQCGEAAYLQSFFCSALGLKTRLIQNLQRPSLSIPPDSHVYNEVWLSEAKQWVLSDFFQNRHLIECKGRLLNASDFYDAGLQNDPPLFTIYRTDTNGIKPVPQFVRDPYFTDAYYLVYFKQTDPRIVYSWKNKFRHYLLNYSHFQIYDPVAKPSNFRHRIKQFVFFGGLFWLFIFAVKLVKRRL